MPNDLVLIKWTKRDCNLHMYLKHWLLTMIVLNSDCTYVYFALLKKYRFLKKIAPQKQTNVNDGYHNLIHAQHFPHTFQYSEISYAAR